MMMRRISSHVLQLQRHDMRVPARVAAVAAPLVTMLLQTSGAPAQPLAHPPHACYAYASIHVRHVSLVCSCTASQTAAGGRRLPCRARETPP